MFNNIIENGLTSTNILICIVVSLLLGFIVSFLHMKTSKYSKNYVTTLFVLPTLVAVIIMLVNGNLGTSVAVLGAFSLIRFRSVPGNSREILNIFFAMVIGLAIGTGYVMFAVVITIIISLVIYLLYILKFGESKEQNKKLKIVIPEDLDYTGIFDDIFNEYIKKYTLEQVKTINMGSMFELNYNIILKDSNKEKEFIDKIRCRNGNLKISITLPIIDQEL